MMNKNEKGKVKKLYENLESFKKFEESIRRA